MKMSCLTEEECAICFDKLKNDITHLSCNHFFHYNCICKWIDKKEQEKNKIILCPLCNQRFDIIKIYLPTDDDILIKFFDDQTKNIKLKAKKSTCVIL
jgi:hypothetical protein